MNTPTNSSFYDIVVLLCRYPIDYNPVEGFSYARMRVSRQNLSGERFSTSDSDVFEILTRSDQLLDFT